MSKENSSGLDPEVKPTLKGVLCVRYTVQSSCWIPVSPFRRSTTVPRTHLPTDTPPSTVRAVPTSPVPWCSWSSERFRSARASGERREI